MESKRPRILQARKISRADVDLVAAILRSGGLAIIPTDTVYGIAADPSVPGAEQRICRVKGRDPGKPIPLLVADIATIKRCGAVFGRTESTLAARFWPGPLTLVLEMTASADMGFATGTTEGFRIPDCESALAVLRRAGALRVTSANRSGEPPSKTAAEAVRSHGDLVDVVLDAGIVLGGEPSTVVRVRNGDITVLREGRIPASELRGVLRG